MAMANKRLEEAERLLAWLSLASFTLVALLLAWAWWGTETLLDVLSVAAGAALVGAAAFGWGMLVVSAFRARAAHRSSGSSGACVLCAGMGVVCGRDVDYAPCPECRKGPEL